MNLDDFMPFIVIGLTAGSIYGLAGTGLVLTYKTSGVFNFAYGAIAAVAAFVFYWLWQRAGHRLAVSPPCLHLRARPADGAAARAAHPACSPGWAPSIQIVGMVGLALGISGALTLWASSWGDTRAESSSSPPFLPTDTFTVVNVNVGYDQAITMGGRARLGHRAVPVLPVLARSASRCARSSTTPTS